MHDQRVTAKQPDCRYFSRATNLIFLSQTFVSYVTLSGATHRADGPQRLTRCCQRTETIYAERWGGGGRGFHNTKCMHGLELIIQEFAFDLPPAWPLARQSIWGIGAWRAGRYHHNRLDGDTSPRVAV
jgi:hypothetical protein